MSAPWIMSFSPTREDVAALLRPAQRFEVLGELRWLLAAGLAGGAVLGVIEDGGVRPPWSYALVGAATLLVLLVGQLWRDWRRARRVAAWPLPARVEVEIDHQAISLVEDGRARHVAWETAREVTRDADRAIIWLVPLADSVVLPRAAFADEADMAAFHAFADARIAGEDEEDFGPLPEAPLSVETTLTAEDARQVSAWAGRPISYLQALVGATAIGAVALGGLALLVADAFGVETNLRSPWLWGALAGALSGAALIGHRFDRAQALAWRDWPTTTARIAIDAEGLRRLADGQETRVDWRRIDRIEERADYLLLRVGAEAYVVPRRAFADEDAFDRFADAARALRRAAVSPAAAIPAKDSA